MHELSQRSYPSDGILSVYDLILIPKWVMEEIEDSTYRSTYVEQLQAQGILFVGLIKQSKSNMVEKGQP